VRQHTYTHVSDPIGKRSSLDFLLLATAVFGSERTGEASSCSNHRWQIDVGQ
jgi:hypothetical protein